VRSEGSGSGWPRVAADALAVALAAAPVVWAFAAAGPPADSAGLLRFAGRLAGVAGLSWFLLAMLLSIRFAGLDGPLGGMLRVWRIHHRLGAASLLLLLAHPVLLALAAAADSPAAVLATLTPPWSFWPLWAGWAALILAMVFLAPSFAFFGSPDYQRWKALHALSAGAALLGIVHALALSRLLSPAQAVWLWGGLGAFAAFAFAWRKGLSRVLSRRPYRITANRRLARGVVELTLEPQGRPIAFEAGQFVYLTPLDPALAAGRGEEHPYSLSSAPRELPVLRIAIKDLGDASQALLDVAKGSLALIEGPYGRFLPPPGPEPALWIGGGIGLTPFVSAARALPPADGVVDVDLVYCANDASRAYFLDELNDVARNVPGFRVHPHFFEDEGRLASGFLSQRVPDLARRRAYICGPQPLIELARQLLHASGVPRRHITCEEFDLL
jgi:predicted ferric reductase